MNDTQDANIQNRLQTKWSHPIRHAPLLSGDDKEFMELFNRKRSDRQEVQEKPVGTDFFLSLLRECREIVLDKDGGQYCLHLILSCIDTFTFDITIQDTLLMSGFDDIEEIKLHLAMAMVEDVPVYGNTAELHAELEQIQKDIIENGVTFEIDGKKQRAKITKYDSIDFTGGVACLRGFMRSSHIPPGEIRILDEKVSANLSKYINAAHFLEMIDSAVTKFESLLDSDKRNESTLQSYIVANPILFGTEYKRILPKHQLGSEYEMDYALERFDGIYDLVEIESSSLPLYNTKHNPSHHLVHAEQQVLDWQEWLEEKTFYAREKLKDITCPKGFVIIGRSSSMDEVARKKLRRRNVTFNNRIHVMTYDDLLAKAKTLAHNIRSGNYIYNSP